MSNELTEYCTLFRLCPVKSMNLLQEWGLVSSNCIDMEEVAPVDCNKTSIGFLRLNTIDLRESKP